MSLFVGPRCLRGWGEAPWGLQRGRELLGVGSREAISVSEKETFKKVELCFLSFEMVVLIVN